MHVKSERNRQRGGGAKEQEREERSERGVFICIFEYTHDARQDARLLSLKYQEIKHNIHRCIPYICSPRVCVCAFVYVYGEEQAHRYTRDVAKKLSLTYWGQRGHSLSGHGQT